MDAITAAVQAHIQNQVAIMKEGIDRLTLSLNEREKNLADALKREKKLIVDLAKARSAAVGWRKRCDEMEIRAICAEGEYNCEKSEAEDLVKEWANLEEKLLARAEKAEAALAEALKKVDASWERGMDDGLDLAELAAQAEKMHKIVTEEPKKPEVTTYKSTDVYRNRNDVSQYGFDKNKTYDEMLDLAVKNNCCVMVKDGSGKWYLKGQGMDFETVKQKVEDATKKIVPRHKNVTLYLIKN